MDDAGLELNQIKVHGIAEEFSNAVGLSIVHEGFSVDVANVHWVLLLDASGSMAPFVDHIKEFLTLFIVEAERFFLDCEFTVIRFAQNVDIAQDLTALEATQAIEKYSTDFGMTNQEKAFGETIAFVERQERPTHILLVTDAKGMPDVRDLWRPCILGILHAQLVDPEPTSIDTLGQLVLAQQGMLQVQNAQHLENVMVYNFARRPHTQVGTLIEIELSIAGERGTTTLIPYRDVPLNVYAEHPLFVIFNQANVPLDDVLDSDVTLQFKIQSQDMVVAYSIPVKIVLDHSFKVSILLSCLQLVMPLHQVLGEELSASDVDPNQELVQSLEGKIMQTKDAKLLAIVERSLSCHGPSNHHAISRFGLLAQEDCMLVLDSPFHRAT